MEIILAILGAVVAVIQLYKWFPKMFPSWVQKRWFSEQDEKLSKISRYNNFNKNQTYQKLLLPRYSVGDIHAEVYLGLLGGGTEVFTYQTFSFQYDHEWVPLPESIIEHRDIWISEQKEEAKLSGKELFNGPAIRLHSFNLGLYQDLNGDEKKCPHLILRPTSWYDYCVTNKIIDKKILISGKGESTIRNEFTDESRLINTRNINWIQLSNILTITVVIITKDYWTLVGKRTRHVDNASQVFAASAAENMHRWKDEPSNINDPWLRPNRFAESGNNVDWNYRPLLCPNPFFTAVRAVEEEISEELSKTISPKEVVFLGIAWSLVEFNPHLYASIKLDINIHDLSHILDGSRSRDSWEVTLIPIKFEPYGALKNILLNEKWAEISKGAILRSLVQEYGYSEVDKKLRV